MIQIPLVASSVSAQLLNSVRMYLDISRVTAEIFQSVNAIQVPVHPSQEVV
jgi:hypothetical protein